MMEKLGKSKRMSLNPAKNPLFALQKQHNATELDVRHVSAAEESQFNISCSDAYPPDELPRIFAALAKGAPVLTCDSLYSLLRDEGYGDNLCAAVEMIALVDHERKGYLTEQQFVAFFSDRTVANEETLPPLPPLMQNRRHWVDAIDQNLQLMTAYRDREYCEYVAEKIAEEAARKREK